MLRALLQEQEGLDPVLVILYWMSIMFSYVDIDLQVGEDRVGGVLQYGLVSKELQDP